MPYPPRYYGENDLPFLTANARMAGQRLNMGGSSAYIDHADAIGSTAMETDPAGGGITLPL